MTLSDLAVAQLRRVIERPETFDGRYVAHEEIGRGGMGVVFRATDTKLEREVALKIINVQSSSATRDAQLAREAQILAHLEHPGIVPVHDTGVLLDGRVFYVMRLVRGSRLDEHSASGVNRGDLLRTMLRLCETVTFAHEHGVVHRDLKPGNVMIGPFGEVLVLDWGVAKISHARLHAHAQTRSQGTSNLQTETPTQSVDGDMNVGEARSCLTRNDNAAHTADGVVIGTPGFMSPEQAAGQSASADRRADVFSLGAILGELLNATTESVPRALRAIVVRATAHDPANRYSSALELSSDLRHWLDGEGVSAYREGVFERAFRFYRRHQVAVLLVAAYLIVRFAIVIFRGP